MLKWYVFVYVYTCVICACALVVRACVAVHAAHVTVVLLLITGLTIVSDGEERVQC